VKDAECVDFLQWALPRMGFRWPGYRRVRRQVCKRVARRLKALGLGDLGAYRAYLTATPAEWAILDSCCRITISRFYRDRGVFEFLATDALPELARQTLERGDAMLRCWSAGCASGEEPYSLAIVWRLALARRFPDLGFEVVATDADQVMLKRARTGLYAAGSLKDLPQEWRARAFEPAGRGFRLRDRFRDCVRFRRQDIRRAMPAGPFDLILCRNLAFTYFDEEGQVRILNRLVARMVPGGALVLGGHETLPATPWRLVRDDSKLPLYWRASGPADGPTAR
jgi:chemotaxis protein methyltransferase CheR